MGEKRTRLRRLLARHPLCAYCGGAAPAVSVDHCPPIAMFDQRLRPQGLEFPACAECHEGTRHMDLVAAVLSRFLAPSDAAPQQEEISKQIRGLLNNHPEVALLFDVRSAQPVLFEGRTVYPVPIRDPERIGRIQDGFTARFGLAMYHEYFGRPAPQNARIAIEWYSNVELFKGDYPEELIRAIGNPRTLSAGKFCVGPQFRYWVAKPDEHMFAVFAVFRESFGLLAIIRTDDNEPLPEDAYVLSPGF